MRDYERYINIEMKSVRNHTNVEEETEIIQLRKFRRLFMPQLL